MNLDMSLLFAGLVAECVVAGLALHKRLYRSLPVFCIFLIWNVLSDAGMSVVGRHYSLRGPLYARIYMVEQALDSLVQFAVLVELAWAVLRPIRASLPRATIFVLAGIALGLGGILWPISQHLTLSGPDQQLHLIMRLQQTSAVLRILFFLVLAGFSQLLAIGWRDRELQIATGLGILSLTGLGTAILHTHHASPTTYHLVDELASTCYLISLLYWFVSFLQPEAARQEFTPRMQNILLTVSGAARANRVALEEIQKPAKH